MLTRARHVRPGQHPRIVLNERCHSWLRADTRTDVESVVLETSATGAYTSVVHSEDGAAASASQNPCATGRWWSWQRAAVAGNAQLFFLKPVRKYSPRALAEEDHFFS